MKVGKRRWQLECVQCGETFVAGAAWAKFCSPTCNYRSKRQSPTERECGRCGTVFTVVTRADCNRRYCSRSCAKTANARRVSTWHAEHPEAMERYRQRSVANGQNRDWYRSRRLRSIELLGGACVVCGVTKPEWLHVDFIPTQINEQHRHPRHWAFIKRNPHLFRLLCANHHYELTLTGRIEGSDITQVTRHDA